MGGAQAIGCANAFVCAGWRHANVGDDDVRPLSLHGSEQRVEVAARRGQLGILLRVLYVLTVVLLATMGALIASRHTDNVIGWLCCAWGLIFAAEMFASEYASAMGLVSPGSLLPGAAWFAWVAQMLNIHIVLIVPVLLLF